MGQIIEGACPCGFTTGELFLGGEMRNFETHCGMPARCTCGELGIYNALAKRPRCRVCRRGVQFMMEAEPTTDPARDEAEFSWVAGDGMRVLRQGGHSCPRCKEDTLRFTPTGCWD